MLLAIANAKKSVQNYLKFSEIAKIWPKTINSRNFKIYGGGTKACTCHLDFQYKNFPYDFFIMAFVCEFVQNNVFLTVPYVLSIWDFVHMWLQIRIWILSIHTYSKKMVFLAPKTILYSLRIGKKMSFFQLWTLWSGKWYGVNVYDLVDM